MQLSEQEVVRRQKLTRLRELGINPYPADLYPVNTYSKDIKTDYYCSHGSVDQVLPVDWARKSKPFLDNIGLQNVYSEYPVGHGVAPQNFYSFKKWIENRL